MGDAVFRCVHEAGGADSLGYLRVVAASPQTHPCPHCGKTFEAALLGPNTARAGYKCPHCKLFVPVARAEDPQRDAA